MVFQSNRHLWECISRMRPNKRAIHAQGVCSWWDVYEWRLYKYRDTASTTRCCWIGSCGRFLLFQHWLPDGKFYISLQSVSQSVATKSKEAYVCAKNFSDFFAMAFLHSVFETMKVNEDELNNLWLRAVKLSMTQQLGKYRRNRCVLK